MPNKNRKAITNGVIYEYISQGQYVKVSAIDIATGTEVSIVGNPAIGKAALQSEANRKLLRILNKTNNKQTTNNKNMTNISRQKNPPSGWDL